MQRHREEGERSMSTAEPTFDPRLPEFHANPYPFYRTLREKDPVHQSPLGFWVLTRYDDVVMSLRDPRFGRDGFAPLLEATMARNMRAAICRAQC
jgi:cytochrome P450